MRHFLLPTAPVTACTLEVAQIEGYTPVHIVAHEGHRSGASGVASDGARADRAGIEFADGELRIGGEPLCDACKAMVIALVKRHGFWRRMLAPAASASTPRSPSASTSSSSAARGKAK